MFARSITRYLRKVQSGGWDPSRTIVTNSLKYKQRIPGRILRSFSQITQEKHNTKLNLSNIVILIYGGIGFTLGSIVMVTSSGSNMRDLDRLWAALFIGVFWGPLAITMSSEEFRRGL